MKRSILPLAGAAMALALCARSASAQGVTPQSLEKAPAASHATVSIAVLPREASSLAKNDARPTHARAARKVKKAPAAGRLAVPASFMSGKHGLMNQPAPGHAPARAIATPLATPSGFAKSAPAGHAPKPVKP